MSWERVRKMIINVHVDIIWKSAIKNIQKALILIALTEDKRSLKQIVHVHKNKSKQKTLRIKLKTVEPKMKRMSLWMFSNWEHQSFI